MIGSTTRLWFLGNCVFLATVLCSNATSHNAVAQQPADTPSVQQWQQLRKQAAARRRRIIFNNDGCDAVYFTDRATPESLLACRTTPLVGSQVDTILYCTWCSGFSNFTHRTQIGHVFTCTENKLSNNKVAQFIEQGTDPLKIMVDFCHKHGMEIFWSFRMNDTHDASTAWYGPLLFPQLKRDHPEWLLGSREKPVRYGRWTAVDYGRPEIRDLAFRFVEEVCRNYDVDGVELDFFRHLNYFKSVAGGAHASVAEREMMTDLLRRIRQMIDTEGRRRQRPILLAVRVPDSAQYCAAVGLDVKTWLAEDLIDLLVVSGYFRLNPWKVSVELAHRHGVPVYACLSESRIRGPAGKLRSSLECYRARAANAWAAGVDGIYLFNYFNPKSVLWKELGDRATLRHLDKLYCTGARSARTAGHWLADGTKFLNRRLVSPEQPLALALGKPVDVPLPVAEEPSTGDADPKAEFTLQLQLADLEKPEQLQVHFNDRLLSNGKASPGRIEYSVPAAAVRCGSNLLRFTLPPAAEKAKLDDVLLRVHYR